MAEFKGPDYYNYHSWDNATIMRQAREITELHHEAAKVVANQSEELKRAYERIRELERDLDVYIEQDQLSMRQDET